MDTACPVLPDLLSILALCISASTPGSESRGMREKISRAFEDLPVSSQARAV